MEVVHKLVNSTLYVGLNGELDESASVLTRTSIDGIFEKCTMKRVVFDMSSLKFMDSTGVGVLIGRYKKLRDRNIPAFLAGPKPCVDKVLSLSGMYTIMPKIDF